MRSRSSYSDKLGHGCWWSSGSATGASPAVGLQSALYAPVCSPFSRTSGSTQCQHQCPGFQFFRFMPQLIEPDKAASFGGVSLTLRSIDDPASSSLYMYRAIDAHISASQISCMHGRHTSTRAQFLSTHRRWKHNVSAAARSTWAEMYLNRCACYIVAAECPVQLAACWAHMGANISFEPSSCLCRRKRLG